MCPSVCEAIGGVARLRAEGVVCQPRSGFPARSNVEKFVRLQR